MSLATWKKTYYPRGAHLFSNNDISPENAIDAIEHSLTKWRGLRKAALDKHGLAKKLWMIREVDGDKAFSISSDTCALCQLTAVDCKLCPIFTALEFECDDDGMPYDIWQETGDPEPMILTLEDTLTYFKEM